jgi:hypothetical protein
MYAVFSWRIGGSMLWSLLPAKNSPIIFPIFGRKYLKNYNICPWLRKLSFLPVHCRELWRSDSTERWDGARAARQPNPEKLNRLWLQGCQTIERRLTKFYQKNTRMSYLVLRRATRLFFCWKNAQLTSETDQNELFFRENNICVTLQLLLL